jgi:2-haloacid dehalogenase
MTSTIVFDAYGTLYDIQSLAFVTEDAFPGKGEKVRQWPLSDVKQT